MHLDHVILAVHDLSTDGRRLADALGVMVQPGGLHAGVGTHNAVVPLGGAYLELIAVQDDVARAAQHPFGARLVADLERGPGWFGFALGVLDLDSAGAEIRGRGLAVGHAQVGSRVRPDGVELRWRTATVDDSPVLPFLIQHAPPRTPETLAHPLGAVGISAVGLAVADLEAWMPTFTHLTGRSPAADAVRFVDARRANYRLDDGVLLRLLTPAQSGIGTVAEHLAQRGEGLFILRLAVRDLEHAVAELARRGTPVSERQADGTVFLLDPRRTLGAHFALVEQG